MSKFYRVATVPVKALRAVSCGAYGFANQVYFAAGALARATVRLHEVVREKALRRNADARAAELKAIRSKREFTEDIIGAALANLDSFEQDASDRLSALNVEAASIEFEVL